MFFSWQKNQFQMSILPFCQMSLMLSYVFIYSVSMSSFIDLGTVMFLIRDQWRHVQLINKLVLIGDILMTLVLSNFVWFWNNPMLYYQELYCILLTGSDKRLKELKSHWVFKKIQFVLIYFPRNKEILLVFLLTFIHLEKRFNCH